LTNSKAETQLASKQASKQVLFSSKSDEWSTPWWIYNELDAEFHFDLDPCSTDENCKCEHYYTLADDGLSKSWSGYNVFCNPPYSQIAMWVEKAYMESRKPNTVVVMLIPSRTDTRWFHNYIYHKAEIRFIKGRLKFGNAIYNAPFPSMVVIFRSN